MYAFVGETKIEVAEESSDKHCFKASLSEQDFESVGGLSALASSPQSLTSSAERIYLPGFRLTTPNCAKDPRPSRGDCNGSSWKGIGQGVASFCASITNSMLASPQGASEQYMMILRSSNIVNDW